MGFLNDLKSELINNPEGLDYSGDEAAQAAVICDATLGRTRLNPIPQPALIEWGVQNGRISKIRTATTTGSDAVKSGAIFFELLLLSDSSTVQPSNAIHVAVVNGLVAAGVLDAADKTALIALATEPISRGTELGFPTVEPKHIYQARNST